MSNSTDKTFIQIFSSFYFCPPSGPLCSLVAIKCISFMRSGSKFLHYILKRDLERKFLLVQMNGNVHR